MLSLATNSAFSGVKLSVHWYWRRILKLLAQYDDNVREILPGNRQIAEQFITSWGLLFVDDLCSGLSNPEGMDWVDWESNTMFLRFKDFILREEKQLERKLRTVNYSIDDENTLAMVTNGARPEKVRDTMCCRYTTDAFLLSIPCRLYVS